MHPTSIETRRMSRRLLVAALTLLALVWAVSAIAARTAAAKVASSNAPSAELHPWRELRSDASRLLGRRVKLVAQFQGPVERWNAYLSRFGPETHVALQFWSDEQFLWRVDEYEWPQVRLFVPRGGAVDEVFAHAATYERFEIEGTLRELFLSEPWIEVEFARRLPEQVSEGTVIHAGRALSLMDAGVWKLADAQLEQSLQALLPAHARAELERLRGLCRAQTPDDVAPAAQRQRWSGSSAPVRIRRTFASHDSDDG